MKNFGPPLAFARGLRYLGARAAAGRRRIQVKDMPQQPSNPIERSWLMRQVEKRFQQAFLRAYRSVGVTPSIFLEHLQQAHDLPVRDFRDMFDFDLRLVDELADETLRGGAKLAAAEGAGFGLGGMMTLVPDMGVLAVITMRTIQKLSLVYGFEYKTDDEVAELWIAAATAAGVDISKDLIERKVVAEFVPRVIARIATRASTEVVEKWAGRIVPLVSSVVGAGLNYYFVRTWGRRAQKHFRERHLARRAEMGRGVIEGRIPPPLPTRALPTEVS